MIRFDFETRSKLDLKKVGSWVYSMHPSTEVLVMSYAHNDSPVTRFVPDVFNVYAAPILWSRAVSSKAELFEAHNVFFEWCIYNNVLVRRFGWPSISPERWRCTRATSLALALPRSLEGVGNAIGLTNGKDMSGHRVMMKLSKPRKPSKNNKDLYHSKPEDFETLYKYCDQDVVTQRDISNHNGPLQDGELLVFLVDQMINRRGVHVDVDAIRGAIHILDVCSHQYQTDIQDATGGHVTSTGQVAKIVEWCRSRGVNLDNLQAGTLEDVLANGVMVYNPKDNSFVPTPIPEDVARVLSIRQSASKSSVKKYAAMLDRVDVSDNRIREILVYHGASTGRWSGSGIQIQNFPRGNYKFKDDQHLEDIITLVRSRDFDGLREHGDVPEILSTLLRSMLCAAPGKKFVAGDYSAIEARVLLWLVGDEHGLNVFRAGGDIYVDMAATIFSAAPADVTKDQRFVGKQAILGLGYQMAWERFQAQCAGYGVRVSEELAKRVVKAYREKYQKVVDYWEAVNAAAIYAVKTVQPVHCGRVTFFMEGDFLKCRLPSGRAIAYYKPHFVPGRFNPAELALAYWGQDSQTKKWVEISTYGGKLTENIDQAIAGDLLRVASIALESNAHPIVLSVHDELVCEVDDTPQFSVQSMTSLMCTLPSWGPDIPVSVECWEGKRFKK